ncbi:hypothetical protein B0H16DRAFT_166486 [Mycena metata]|uniref:Uncharacterized protein n=1 Tax=Mycena metata TaxID=1033252 RepID=A0AAD7JX92_9AGAR|nr:hypothetical protein B0H16DRAFT_166486 [Mycena metata]
MSPSHFFTYFPLVIDTLVYGIYSTLFIQAVQVLSARWTPGAKFYLGPIILLFTLSTIHIALAYAWAFITDRAQTGIYELFSLDNPLPVLYGPDDPDVVHRLGLLIKIRYTLANTLADGIILYRCYVIWGYNWRPLTVPAFSYACTIIGGILGIIPLSGTSERVATAACMLTIFCTNIIASSLAAGRIWWMSRRIARLQGRTNARRKYRDLTAIMLESGLIYPAALAISFGIFVSPATSTTSVLICIAVCYHIVGIAPTLIIVRVGLGVSTDGVEETTRRDQTRPPTSIQFIVQDSRKESEGRVCDPEEAV